MVKLNISTDRLLIRELQLDDLDDFYIYRSNPQVTKYQGFDVMTKAQAEKFIQENLEKSFGEAGKWVQYAIEKKETGNVIGDCAIRLDKNDKRIAEIGITLSHNEQRKGYAKEAMLGILTYLFEKKGIFRVVETVDADNIASINLLKGTGFRQEGYFIENVFFKGKWCSEYQFAMLKREWNQIRSKTI